MPTPGTIAIIILVILILAVIVSCIQIVQQSKAYVVERLGAFHSVWGVGMHFKLPFIERVVKKVSLKEQVADFDPQPVITKDNVTMQIDTVIYFQITDPKLYTYGVEYPMSAIENLTATTLRNIIGELELDQSLTSRDTINAKMRSILDEATDPWGIKVNRVELKNILPFIIESIGLFDISLRDPSLRYPVSRAESRDQHNQADGAHYHCRYPQVFAAPGKSEDEKGTSLSTKSSRARNIVSP